VVRRRDLLGDDGELARLGIQVLPSARNSGSIEDWRSSVARTTSA
jgi:hypothetical protein